MQGSAHTAKHAAALATWIVIQAIERNPDYFDEVNRAEDSTSCLDQGLTYGEQERYSEALQVMKSFLGKVLVQAPHIIKGDSELLEALGTLAQLDKEYVGGA
jgi:hypothetical protein